MNQFLKTVLTPALVVGLLFGLAGAPDVACADESTETEAPRAVVKRTDHSIRIDGERVDYSAYVGWMIQEKNDEPVARFGYTAYLRKGVDEPGKRPLVFAFNGGPGSSSI
mgnify:FL=1